MATQLRKLVYYHCVARHHLAGRCPYCSTGVFLATCPEEYSGIIESPCGDCGQTVPLYVVMAGADHKAWMLAERINLVRPQQAKKASEQGS